MLAIGDRCIAPSHLVALAKSDLPAGTHVLQTGEYYRRYDLAPPPEWVERPARVYNNLMEFPTVFYALCLLLMYSDAVDGPQWVLAWTFVLLRWAHAVAYLVWNYLPTRFGLYFASYCIDPPNRVHVMVER